MFLNILEIMGLIVAYVLIGTVVKRSVGWIIDEEDHPLPIIVGVMWPAAVPFVLAISAALYGVMSICYVSNCLIDKVTSSVTAMWEEWRA